jgi:hypothetical protein
MRRENTRNMYSKVLEKEEGMCQYYRVLNRF